MEIHLKVFGALADIVKPGTVPLPGNADTDSLLEELILQYPALRDKKFGIAVDQKTIGANTPLSPGSTVALLPPFSGG